MSFKGKSVNIKAPVHKEPKDPNLLQLTSSDPTHLDKWAEKQSLAANKLFPKLNSVFINENYPVIKFYSRPAIPWTEENDPGRFERDRQANLIKRQGDHEDKLEAAKSELFSIMLNDLSENSLNAVKQQRYKESTDGIYDNKVKVEKRIAKLNRALQRMDLIQAKRLQEIQCVLLNYYSSPIQHAPTVTNNPTINASCTYDQLNIVRSSSWKYSSSIQ